MTFCCESNKESFFGVHVMSQADRDGGRLLPQYDHTRDQACLTYTKSKAFRRNKARHDRMERKAEKLRNKKEVSCVGRMDGWMDAAPL